MILFRNGIRYILIQTWLSLPGNRNAYNVLRTCILFYLKAGKQLRLI